MYRPKDRYILECETLDILYTLIPSPHISILMNIKRRLNSIQISTRPSIYITQTSEKLGHSGFLLQHGSTENSVQ